MCVCTLCVRACGCVAVSVLCLCLWVVVSFVCFCVFFFFLFSHTQRLAQLDTFVISTMFDDVLEHVKKHKATLDESLKR